MCRGNQRANLATPRDLRVWPRRTCSTKGVGVLAAIQRSTSRFDTFIARFEEGGAAPEGDQVNRRAGAHTPSDKGSGVRQGCTRPQGAKTNRPSRMPSKSCPEPQDNGPPGRITGHRGSRPCRCPARRRRQWENGESLKVPPYGRSFSASAGII